METARAKEEEGADKNNSKIVQNMEGRNVGTIGRESPKQGLISAKDPIELPPGCVSPYHRLD